jgi:hypothetical protein
MLLLALVADEGEDVLHVVIPTDSGGSLDAIELHSLYRFSADLVKVAGGWFGSAYRSRTAAMTSRLVACSSLSFLVARFCLMVLLGFLMVACRGDLSAMALLARPGV